MYNKKYLYDGKWTGTVEPFTIMSMYKHHNHIKT